MAAFPCWWKPCFLCGWDVWKVLRAAQHKVGFGSLAVGRSSVEQLCTRGEAWGDTGFSPWPPSWPSGAAADLKVQAGPCVPRQKGRAVRDRKAQHGKLHTLSSGICVLMPMGLCPERVQEGQYEGVGSKQRFYYMASCASAWKSR